MRKHVFIVLALLAAMGARAFAQVTTYGVSLGANFFEYSNTALETGLGVVMPLQEGLSFEAKVAYAVRPAADGAFMAVPLQGGVRFSFGSEPVGFHCSIGLEPVFTFNPDSFRLGPYLGLEGSVRVHPFMELFIGLEQDLLFGGPDYVSTGTRALGGLRFSLSE
ncbi:MAG: hypothetical protein CVV47_08940 [Spirochaetae bacterium HGW-Spirochaetae-3]|jgi:hypothetical protein|nr:MAG: hypothetical protein CVV47_08940 [Spirochaetae bacterium HGW-Spirochaetae-3]